VVKNYRRIFVKQMVGSELTSTYHLVYEGSLKMYIKTVYSSSGVCSFRR